MRVKYDILRAVSTFVLLLCTTCMPQNTGAHFANPAAEKASSGSGGPPHQTELLECGHIYAPPFGHPVGPGRVCEAREPRSYQPKYRTIAHEVLDLESEACWVPDSAYRLLDELIADADAIGISWPNMTDGEARRAAAIEFSTQISNVLERRGFELHIPVKTLSDSLFPNATTAHSTYLFDCDTGSLIFLGIAEHRQLPVSMVDVMLSGETAHNYVQWNLGHESVNWDLDGRSQCRTPDSQPFYLGRAMTRDEVYGYIYFLRALTWRERNEFLKALDDYRRSVRLYSVSPKAANSLAWLISTKPELQTGDTKKEALLVATQAAAIARTADILDTLACATALNGDFHTAKKIQLEVVQMPGGEKLRDRLARFDAGHDCTGL